MLEEACRTLLKASGDDWTREGLRDTPARFAKAWLEYTDGYTADIGAILKTFTDGGEAYRDMVIVHNIRVQSLCEHHLAPITGIAHVGYVPDGRIVGLSKLARLVEAYARRLQVQERMTAQIADAIMQWVIPQGAAVLVRCAHACMSARGIRLHGSVTTTSALRGAFFADRACRDEFLRLCADAERTGT